MFETLLERLYKLFPKQDYKSRLESYIESKNPQNAADIEHHMKEYDRKLMSQQGGW